MAEIKLEELSDEQKAILKTQWEKEAKDRALRVKNERETYKTMVDNEVRTLFPQLQGASDFLANVKTVVFDNLKSLIKLKSELYDREQDQGSHSFSTSDGNITITVGYNMTDGWDDTVNIGITKVNDYLQSLISDEKSKNLVDLIMKLLVKDSKGNLKASRVLQLKQLADKTEDAHFKDAIAIIQDAYKPVRSKEFVRCEFKGLTGEKLTLPLSITEASFLEKSNQV